MPSKLEIESVEQLKQIDSQVVWHAFSQMYEYQPLIAATADGCTITDIEGKTYIDGCSSLWCNVHGHRHPHIDAAIRKQLDRVAHVTNLGMSCDTTVRLAQKLVEITPVGLEHVFFSSDGASAVEVALKMAFQYWRQIPEPQPRSKYISLSNGYHGDTIGTTSVGGVARFHELFRPLLFETIQIDAPNRYLIPDGFSEQDWCQEKLNQLRKILRAQSQEIAAVVMEPLVQGAAGMLMHAQGFLAGVRALADEFNTILICDEVAVGFGRTGTLFACEQEQISPDILCLGKGLSGGYLPVSATLACTKIWDAFYAPHAQAKTLFHGHTFGGNPLGAAAAIATLEVFENEKTIQNLSPKIDRIQKRLIELAEQFPMVIRPRQTGMMVAFDLGDATTGEVLPWERNAGQAFCNLMIEQGVWLRPLGSSIILMPPLAITEDQIDLIFSSLVRCLKEFYGSGIRKGRSNQR